MNWSGLPERIERKIIPEPNSGCWLWLGGLDTRGYSQCRFEGRTRLAYRAAYIILIGEPPRGLVLDHTCNNKICVNPEHLKPTSHQLNITRSPQTIAGKFSARHACKYGHPFTEENTAFELRSRARICITCRRLRNLRWKLNNPEKYNAARASWARRKRKNDRN